MSALKWVFILCAFLISINITKTTQADWTFDPAPPPTAPPTTGSCDTTYQTSHATICWYNYNNSTTPGTFISNDIDGGDIFSVNQTWNTGNLGNSNKSEAVYGVYRQRFYFPAGRYTFHTNSDDGVILNVADIDVISDWSNHSPRQRDSVEYDWTSTPGYRNVTVRYYEDTGSASLRVWYTTSTPTTPPTAPPTAPPQAPPASTPGPGAQPTYTVTGVVFVDANNNGTQDTGGSNPEQCYPGNVRATLSNGTVREYAQDAACTQKYTFDGLTPGSYTITISPIPSYVFSVNRTYNFSVP